nr:Phage protein Gp37/Gp68-like protein [uncultured Mediterranean phage uvMED]BAR15218.1 Phage protein Gp37/Gp68-like protein [uncultured Mediterranean phage uvMED]BAR15274.1 Phage protein Gp37/Gp68-like protein [uncultured Mediterranean phage uvMED]
MNIDQLRNRDYKIPNKLMFKGNNPKLNKHTKIEALKKYWEMHLNLIPSNISGYEVCASKSKGCAAACLHTAGNKVFMPQKTLGRTTRTLMYFKERAKFLHMITKEIRNHEINCKKHGLKAVIRLNTTSDIMWESHKIFELFPNVQFYDYTKHFKRMMKYLRGELPNNYHLTFSLNEANHTQGDEVLKCGGNVAMVFRKQLPKTYKGYRVINGDKHDMRFTDPKNVIVGLTAKGEAKTDQSGFVID